jgi:glutamate receptor, ionotropic, invertebrate
MSGINRRHCVICDYSFLLFENSQRQAEEDEVLEGNHRFEGYSLDLIDAISKILRFNYRIELVPDGKTCEHYFCNKNSNFTIQHIRARE